MDELIYIDQESNVGYTENGAVSLQSTTDARLNLFFKTVRDLGSFTDDSSNQELYDMIDKSFLESPVDTVRILMNWRDCRGGKGDHRGFLVAFAYLSKEYPVWFKCNLHLLSEYGSYLDYVKLWHLVDNTYEAKTQIMDLIVKTLKSDVVALQTDSNSKITLLAKWLPSEKYKWDRYNNNKFVYELCRKFFRVKRVDNYHLKMLRKQVLVPLRNHINIVESKMCAKKFDEIDYQAVPSVAMNKYKDAFTKNDSDRFAKYLEDVEKGEKKINSSQVYPHDLVRQYLNHLSPKVDNVIEAQWNEIKKKVQQSKAFDNSIAVCDVSGSMDGIPMEVAIALGLLGLHDNKMITFSEQPSLYHVPEGTLYEQVQLLKNMPWGYNTNFERVMDLVIGLSARKPEDSIKRVFIFSDMQFDEAVGLTHGKQRTHFNMLIQRFKDAGVEMPQIVFWNLRGGTKDFPVKSDECGVIMMSGYSPALLNGLLEGKEVTPLSVMMNIIDSPRYELVEDMY
jgi:Domain of unknown function (DUF2828)